MSRLAVAYTGVLMKGRRALTRWLPRYALSYLAEGPPVIADIRQLLRRHLIPGGTEWVQIQQGFAKGLWIQIDLARERSWWAGTHEPVAQEVLRQIVNKDTVFYDVGAHIGFFSLPTARKTARVVAFEPDPENAERLRAHVVRNHLSQGIEVVETALWSDTAPSITFRTGNPRSQGGVAHDNHQPVLATGSLIQVRATRLDDFVSDGKPAPHIIKVDVEGGAAEVLIGAMETVRISRPTLIIEVHTSSEYDGILRLLEPFSYLVLWDIPPEGFPRQCLAFGDPFSLSTLAMKLGISSSGENGDNRSMKPDASEISVPSELHALPSICDHHPGLQQIASIESETGELTELRIEMQPRSAGQPRPADGAPCHPKFTRYLQTHCATAFEMR